ncbi:6-bladed beta-propeller [candidate division KSB1 bacterium]
MYDEGDYVTLEKLYGIPLLSDRYEITRAGSMDVDSYNNLYILAPYESKILVFNDKGRFLRSLGQPGQGPQDLWGPRNMAIYDDRIYVLEGYMGIKVLDTHGTYLNKIPVKPSNYFFMRPVQENFFMLSFQPDQKDRSIRHYLFSKVSSDSEEIVTLLNFEHNNGVDFLFYPAYALAVARNDNFYFPENANNYSIMKYDETGNLLFAFKRDFTRVPFSEETVDNYRDLYGIMVNTGQVPSLPEFFPVIRKLFPDSRENVWVVSGEIYQERFEMETDGTIDIFNEDGIWLHTFTMKEISVQSVIKKNRLYNATKISPVDGQQYVNVYKIDYKYDFTRRQEYPIYEQ